jgi:orotidine-5'-phosphate decarboxylase
MATFVERLQGACRANRSLVCVGLDPDPSRMPVRDVTTFNRAIVEATADLVCAYKPNLAFYEALGMTGLKALEETLKAIRKLAPSAIVIGDAKRGDIGNTATAYAAALFDVWGFDAATVNPYLGGDSVEPFLAHADRGAFILCRTSNPGAREFQDLRVPADVGSRPLYESVARKAGEWNTRGNVGLVVGATYPDELKRIRGLCPPLPILIPGVGAQAGDLDAAVLNGTDADGRLAVINSSRGIIYASRGADYAQAARRAATTLRDQANDVLKKAGHPW